MRDSLIQYLSNPNDGNLLSKFLYEWISHKMPSHGHNEIVDFINIYLNHLIHVPSMIDSRYKEALDSLLSQAQVELKVNHLKDKNGNILKFL